MAAYRYWRLHFTRWRNAGSDGTTGPVRVGELQFVTAGGAVWPQAALTAANAPAPYVVSASSQYSTFAPYLAFDGVASDANRWMSDENVSSAWLQIDMGSAQDFDRIRYAPDNAATFNGGYCAVDFEVWASSTGAFAGEHTVVARYHDVVDGWVNSTLREITFAEGGDPAYPVNESFTTRVPLGFGTSASTVTATYSAAQQAVDVAGTASATWALWRVSAVPLSAALNMVFDLELVSDSAGIRHLGIWLLTGNGYEGVRFAQQGGQTYTHKLSFFDAAGVEVFTMPLTGVPLQELGGRRTWRVDYTAAVGGNPGRVVFSIDGVPLAETVVRGDWALRPAILAYGSTVRVHSVVGAASSAYAAQALTHRGMAVGMGRLSNGAQGNQPGAPGARALLSTLARRNCWQGGNGRVSGTVEVKGTPNIPVARKVRLHNEATGLLVAETWSEAGTGAYSFDNVDPQPKYTTLSYDHTAANRAVIADGQVAEPMP